MQVSKLNFLVFALSAAALGPFLVWAPHPETSPVALSPAAAPAKARDPLEAFPPGASLVVTADVAQFRTTRWGKLLSSPEQSLPKLAELQRLCGFDPGAKLDRMVLVIPESKGTAVEFGVSAQGRFETQALQHCAEKVMRERQGTPEVKHQGSFVTLRNASAAGEQPELALGPGGSVLIGGAPYLRRMLQTFAQGGASVAEDPKHRKTREILGAGGTLIATWTMTPERWVSITGTEAVRLSSMSAIRTAGIRLDFSDTVHLRATASCPDTETCHSALTELNGIIQGLAPSLKESLGTDLPDRVKLEAGSDELHLDLTIRTEEAAALITGLLSNLPT